MLFFHSNFHRPKPRFCGRLKKQTFQETIYKFFTMAQALNLKGTQTEKNLAEAYIAESTAVTRYTFYAQQAEKEQYYQFKKIFSETADNELHHAKIFLKYLTEGGITPGTISVDMGVLSNTLENLKIAIKEETHEGVGLYLNDAKIAREEGFNDLADQFEAIAQIEATHKARFEKMAERIENGTVWKREQPVEWVCEVCGYVFEGTEPPKVCPACFHPYQHYDAPDYGK